MLTEVKFEVWELKNAWIEKVSFGQGLTTVMTACKSLALISHSTGQNLQGVVTQWLAMRALSNLTPQYY